MAWVQTISADELAENEMQQVVMEDGHKIALVHLSDGIYAIDDTCTHAEASLSEGDVIDSRVKCPLHGAEFEIKSGDVKAFPAVIGVATYDTKIEENTIYVNYGE